MPDCIVCGSPVDLNKEDYIFTVLRRHAPDGMIVVTDLSVSHASCEGF